MSLTRSLPDVAPGDPITAKRFNKVQRLASAVRTSGAGMTIGGNDYFRSIATVSEGGTKSVRFTIQVVEDDYLRGFETDNATAGGGSETEVLVSKPPKLRRTPWDGTVRVVRGVSITYNYLGIDHRRASAQGEVSEDQYIVEPYQAGDVIDILRVIRLTGVAVVDQAAGSIRRLDLNTDGRMWGFLIPE